MRTKLDETIFFFDREEYQKTMRIYSHVLNCANEVAQEISTLGIDVSTELLRAFLDIHEKKVKASSNVELVDKNVGALPDFYTTVLCISDDAMKVVRGLLDEQLNNLSTFIRRNAERQQSEGLQQVIDNCYKIRHTYNTNFRGVTPFNVVRLDCIVWNDAEGCAMLDADKMTELKDSFNVRAQSANAQKVYNTLLKVCEMLNEILPICNDKTRILDVITQNPISGDFDILRNFDYNKL